MRTFMTGVRVTWKPLTGQELDSVDLWGRTEFSLKEKWGRGALGEGEEKDASDIKEDRVKLK